MIISTVYKYFLHTLNFDLYTLHYILGSISLWVLPVISSCSYANITGNPQFPKNSFRHITQIMLTRVTI